VKIVWQWGMQAGSQQTRKTDRQT